MVSMKIVEKAFTTGSDDCRPRARATPMGKESRIPPAERINVTSRPPQNVVDTLGRNVLSPKPFNNARLTKGTNNHPIMIYVPFIF